jgi:hypothetical protein
MPFHLLHPLSFRFGLHQRSGVGNANRTENRIQEARDNAFEHDCERCPDGNHQKVLVHGVPLSRVILSKGSNKVNTLARWNIM